MRCHSSTHNDKGVERFHLLGVRVFQWNHLEGQEPG